MDYGKLTADLAVAFDDFQAAGREGLRAHERRLGLVSVDPVRKPPRVVVFLHCEEDASLDHLGELGVEVNAAQGTVRTGVVPLEALERLSEDQAVRRVVPARRLRPMVDVAAAKVHVPELRSASGLTGKGVVVGMVDSGIETTHPDFDGRILRIWDQTLNGPGVPEGAYGVELTGSGLEMSRDTGGHGTHVAGIAAGADPDGVYPGVAPEADLVIVKSDLLTTQVADGVRYVFRVARDLGRPAVVNLSVGGHDDPHDGTDSLSGVLDAESGPGRIVCCSAGNSGNDNVHAGLQLHQGHPRAAALALVTPPAPPAGQPAPPAGQAPPPLVTLTGWYSSQDEVEVAVSCPSGPQTPFQPVLTGASPVGNYELPDGSVRITTPGPDPANGDLNFLVQIQPAAPTGAAAAASKPSPWRVRLRGRRITNGRVDIWTVDESAAQFTGAAVEDGVKVGSPGAASRVVTVGAYTTRVEWQDMFGDDHELGFDLDDISDFSSEGPRRDGAPKPEVTAPGTVISSSASVHSPVTREMLMDDRHVLMAGTSMASAFVSGLVALLLQRDPALDPEAVKDVLRRHSAVPKHPAGEFDPKWGYGLVDAAGLADGAHP